MSKHFLTFVLGLSIAFASSSCQGALVAQYNFSSLAAATVSVPVSIVAPNVIASNIVRGPGLTAENTTGAFNATNWPTGGINLDDYYGFTLTPTNGRILNIDSIAFNEQRSDSGIRDIALRSSLDGFSNNLVTVTVPDSGANRRQVFTLSSVFDSIDAPVTFRIYAFNSESTQGTFRLGSGTPNNLFVDGTVTAVPEPSSLAVLTLCGIGGSIYQRRRRKQSVAAPSL